MITAVHPAISTNGKIKIFFHKFRFKSYESNFACSLAVSTKNTTEVFKATEQVIEICSKESGNTGPFIHFSLFATQKVVCKYLSEIVIELN